MFLLSACIVFPVTDKEATCVAKLRCELSSDKKILKVIDVAKETISFYSVSGIVISPTILPVSGLLSGSYTLVNNIYFYGEQKIKCDNREQADIKLRN
ncbi:hypothetical protein [Pseudoalteromonas sp. G4]|uniref:hypothetical protein n=1 Tax=Pseudoalteromonas sp. G4 TaxID=2992761 RepID=UPI00237E47DB|nr:hypothetical protein [Pseudoalteromonas sp. G4]MDE3272561.1 hypothetical protein [Pseudoalteromonas sp. G4]